MYVSKTLPVATAFALWTATSHAQGTTDAIATQFRNLGFDFVEITKAPTQTKVEAVMADGRKVEVIYDNATGEIIAQDTERADDDELTLRGVEIDQEDEDFLNDDDDDSDDDDDDDDDDSDDDDDD